MSRLTIRARLTLVYGGLFLLAGIVLLGVTYVLVDQRLPNPPGFRVLVNGAVTDLPRSAESPGTVGGVAYRTPDGDVIAPADVPEFIQRQTEALRNDALRSLLTQGGVALLIVGVGAVGFGWLLAGRVLAPVSRITDTARRIASAPAADRGLHERIALDGPRDELRELADTFDAMLVRLDHAFDGQRRFVANASHELRTPLTLNRALLEVAVHRKTASADVRQLGETLLDINTRHERLINGLLLLARSENEVTERSLVDLADVVEHVVAQATTEARDAGVEIVAEPGHAETSGDPVLLERLTQNLVENGVRHNTDPGGWVRVATRATLDGRAELVVANTGPTVPQYDIPGIFEPFRRLDNERQAGAHGAGLGLSIVRSVARAHGGTVDAEPRPGGGLTVTVMLPAAAAGRA
jgi:signal transduction histidine kinase